MSTTVVLTTSKSWIPLMGSMSVDVLSLHDMGKSSEETRWVYWLWILLFFAINLKIRKLLTETVIINQFSFRFINFDGEINWCRNKDNYLTPWFTSYWYCCFLQGEHCSVFRRLGNDNLLRSSGLLDQWQWSRLSGFVVAAGNWSATWYRLHRNQGRCSHSRISVNR